MPCRQNLETANSGSTEIPRPHTRRVSYSPSGQNCQSMKRQLPESDLVPFSEHFPTARSSIEPRCPIKGPLDDTQPWTLRLGNLREESEISLAKPGREVTPIHMDAREAQLEFEEYVAEHGAAVSGLLASQGVALMISFYRDRRPSDKSDDDLLYQWGAFDWGSGEFFDLDITRQFIHDAVAEDDNIWQLSLTFRYAPTDGLRALGSGNRWCGTSRPQGIDYFAQWIEKSVAFQAVSHMKPDRIELNYQCVG